MSSFMASTQRTKASRSSLGNSGSRTRCTVTPWRSSTAARRPPPRASTCTSTPQSGRGPRRACGRAGRARPRRSAGTPTTGSGRGSARGGGAYCPRAFNCALSAPIASGMPHARLRPLIALIALIGVGVLAGSMALTSTNRLSDAYERSGAATPARDRHHVRRRLHRGRPARPGQAPAPDRASPRGQRGHPQALRLVAGSTRAHATSSPPATSTTRTAPSGTSPRHARSRSPRGAQAAPIDEGRYGLREVRSSDGVHYAELNYAIDRVQAGARRWPRSSCTTTSRAATPPCAPTAPRSSSRPSAARSLLGLFIALLLGRLVVRPLDRIRTVADAIRGGDNRARLRLGAPGRDRRARARLRRPRRRSDRGAQGPAHRPPQPSRVPGAPGAGDQPLPPPRDAAGPGGARHRRLQDRQRHARPRGRRRRAAAARARHLRGSPPVRPVRPRSAATSS